MHSVQLSVRNSILIIHITDYTRHSINGVYTVLPTRVLYLSRLTTYRILLLMFTNNWTPEHQTYVWTAIAVVCWHRKSLVTVDMITQLHGYNSLLPTSLYYWCFRQLQATSIWLYESMLYARRYIKIYTCVTYQHPHPLLYLSVSIHTCKTLTGHTT